MRKLIFLYTILSLVFILTACSMQLSVQGQTAVSTAETDLLPADQVVESPEPPFAGKAATFNGVELVIPDALSSDIAGSVVPGQEGSDFPYWDIFPQYTQLDLLAYPLQGTLLRPQILVYPAQEYASLQAVIADNQARLGAILADPTQPLTEEILPIHLVNAARLYAAGVKVLDFQNGQGVRYLAQHAQYFAPANNQDLFYFFCGLTSDQSYYVVAILPVRTDMLPDQPDMSFPVDVTGLSDAQIEAAVQDYYAGIKTLLESASADPVPELETLDNLINSLRIGVHQ